MAQKFGDRDVDRLKSALAVAALHALLGYALITGLGAQVAGEASERLRIFDLTEEPPPPIEEAVAVDAQAKDPEGAAAPPSPKAKATPTAAPPPKVRIEAPTPLIAAPTPNIGSDPSTGAADVKGPGTGSGGIGMGTGSGRGGSGAGGGGIASKARHIKGRLVNSDYPRAASRARASGTVFVRFTVGADGRTSGCTVTQSSGNTDLDRTTCRLIEKRFRYDPARDAPGRPVPSPMGWKQVWWFE